MKAAEKMRRLAPELERLKKKYGQDKQALARAQMDFYRQQGINPAAGCLPQIIQLIILIALYQSFIQFLAPDGVEVIKKANEILYPPLKLASDTVINTRFLWLDLAKPDVIKVAGLGFPLPGLFLIAAALVQFVSSKMMMPVLSAVQKEAAKTPEKSDDMAMAMQTQMTYLFPLMTILIGFSFASGLVLYWFVFSLFSAVQQYFVSGWGGLTPWIKKIEKGELKINDGKLKN
jgi:YidC/Oxa1 family membrane protein insertase